MCKKVSTAQKDSYVIENISQFEHIKFSIFSKVSLRTLIICQYIILLVLLVLLVLLSDICDE